MMDEKIRGKVAITGVATAGCGEAPGYSDMELLEMAARQAVTDAGLTMKDIDGRQRPISTRPCGR